MTPICDYRQRDGLYVCSVCGDKRKRPVKRACRSRGGVTAERIVEPAHWLCCPDRGAVVGTLPASVTGEGCAATQTEVFHCRRFREPVLKACSPKYAGRVAKHIPGYTGRTCRECEAASESVRTKHADIFHVTQKPSWQIMRERSEEVLRAAGLQFTCAEITKPTPAKLAEEITQQSPRVVFVHAFALEAKHIVATAGQFPGVAFVVVLHSQDNHVLTWPQFYPQIRDVLQASQRLSNLWYAVSDAGERQWQTLGYRRVIRFYQPCAIYPFREPPAVDPPVVLISSRSDIVKAVPSQLIAAGILQRQRGVRVAVSIQNANDQMLRCVTEAAGVRYGAWPWLRVSEFVGRLRDHVSIVLQPSMSETFNYVSWEACSVGRPFVGSQAIGHTPPEWRADPNDATDIAQVAGAILDDYEAQSRRAREIAERVAREHNAGYIETIQRLLR